MQFSNFFGRQFVPILTAHTVTGDNLCQSLPHLRCIVSSKAIYRPFSPPPPKKKELISVHIVAGDNICFRPSMCAESTGMNCHQRNYTQGLQNMSPQIYVSKKMLFLN